MSMPGWHDSHARRSQNGEVIGPLTGQIRLPLPCLIGPAGRVPCACCERGLDLGLLGLEPREVALQLLALGAHGAQRARLVRARAGEADPRVDEALLGARDLVAALLDDRGEPLLAALELVQALGRRRRVGLGVAHDLDDVLVLLGDALHELAALEQVGEALGGHDHGDDVGLVGLVELDEALRRAPCGPGPGGRAGARGGGARRAGRAGSGTARRAWRRGRPGRWPAGSAGCRCGSAAAPMRCE